MAVLLSAQNDALMIRGVLSPPTATEVDGIGYWPALPRHLSVPSAILRTMTIGDDIAAWAKSRPLWQQEILQTLAAGDPITEAEIASAIDALLDPPDTVGPTKPLNLALASADELTVTLAALRGCKGVNALTDDQELGFSTAGLTVVYGDNGSDKSGYARLIKEAVGARHPAQILPDVFEDRPDEPSAVMHYEADGDAREHKVPGPADPSSGKCTSTTNTAVMRTSPVSRSSLTGLQPWCCLTD